MGKCVLALLALAAIAGAAQLELSWDTGSVNGATAWYTGAGSWGANDFNISTLAAYNRVASARIYYYPNWPNSILEGNREAVWSFLGGTPGSLLWGPTYVRGTTAMGWNTFAVGWTLGAVTAFVMAFEQYYNYPVCDPVLNWSWAGTTGHSWYYYAGAWASFPQLGYGNYPLMIRCTVDDSFSGVAPASLGRVKALYR